MNWHLTKAQDGVQLGGFSSDGAYPFTTKKYISRLLPRSWKRKSFLGEAFWTANTFLQQFVNVNGDFPYQDFLPLGWVHSSPKG